MATVRPKTLSLSTVVRQSQNFVAADMGGEIAMMDIESGKYLCLNETSSRIWELLDTPRRISEVCSALEREFEVTPAQCQTEVLEHMEQLLSGKLVEVVNAAAA